MGAVLPGHVHARGRGGVRLPCAGAQPDENVPRRYQHLRAATIVHIPTNHDAGHRLGSVRGVCIAVCVVSPAK